MKQWLIALLIIASFPLQAQEVLTEDEELSVGSIPKSDRTAPEMGNNNPISNADLQVLKQAIASNRAKTFQETLSLNKEAQDASIKTLIEMLALRAGEFTSQSYVNFLQLHPNFIGSAALRRKAEGKLYDEDKAYSLKLSALTAKGKLLKAKASNDAALAREAFTSLEFGAELERDFTSVFPALNSRENWRGRMDFLLEKGEYASALRSAAKIGEGEQALVKLRSAFDDNKAPPRSFFNSVPSSHHNDPHYLLAKAQLHRRADENKLAAPILISSKGANADYWIERRMIARRLLDEGEPQLAYKVAASHHGKGADQLDAEFFAGFIALRYVKDTNAALKHFDKGARTATTPSSQSRLAYWLGRAYEQAGNQSNARAAYSVASKHTTHFYGQLARSKLGSSALQLQTTGANAVTKENFNRLNNVKAIKALYQLGENDMARGLLNDAMNSFNGGENYSLLASLARSAGDAKGELLVGKIGQMRGFATDDSAFPTHGIPAYKAVEGSAEKSVVYAIARQESTFDPKAQSHAGAMGLLQLMPATAQKTASKAGLSYEKSRLISDPAFNAQVGAAHLGELLSDYNGSYILTFAAYNAGAKRATEWVERYGDPRTGAIDPIDFIERIPFTETRLYVQKVMENVQVYKVRFGGTPNIEADLRRGRRG